MQRAPGWKQWIVALLAFAVLTIALSVFVPGCAVRQGKVAPRYNAARKVIAIGDMPVGPACPLCAAPSRVVGYIVYWHGDPTVADGSDLPLFWCTSCGNVFTAQGTVTPIDKPKPKV